MTDRIDDSHERTTVKQDVATLSMKENLAIAIASLTLMAQIGTWFWWGGRIEERMDNLEESAKETRQLQANYNERDNVQAAQIAVINSQYSELLRRLGNIEGKIDEKLERLQ